MIDLMSQSNVELFHDHKALLDIIPSIFISEKCETRFLSDTIA